VLKPDPDLVLRPGRFEPAPCPREGEGGEGEGEGTQTAGDEPACRAVAAAEAEGLSPEVEAALADVLDRSLMRQAFTHASYANEHPEASEGDNERLEFLGDAVLALCVSEHLVRRYPGWPEGELTRVRAAVVCEPTLACRALSLGLGNRLRLGKGEASGGGKDKPSILSGAFEALVGAVYLEAGLERASRFVLEQLAPDIEAAVRGELHPDYKTRLQQLAQQAGRSLEYRVVAESGPDHQPRFTVQVRLDGEEAGEGKGRSKKEAEQAAACAALQRLARQ